MCSLDGRIMAFGARDIRSIRITPSFSFTIGDIVYLVEFKICNLERTVRVRLSPRYISGIGQNTKVVKRGRL